MAAGGGGGAESGVNRQVVIKLLPCVVLEQQAVVLSYFCCLRRLEQWKWNPSPLQAELELASLLSYRRGKGACDLRTFVYGQVAGSLPILDF